MLVTTLTGLRIIIDIHARLNQSYSKPFASFLFAFHRIIFNHTLSRKTLKLLLSVITFLNYVQIYF